MTLDRVVVIAGAAGQLGRVAARQLARDGARLGLLGSRLERLEEVAGELGLGPDRVLLHASDLRDPAAAGAAIGAVTERFGTVEVLIQAVGGWTGGVPLASVSLDEVRAMLDQHVWTTVHLLRAAIPAMTARGWGRIVAVSSPTALEPKAGSVAYAAAKAAQDAIIRTAARELEGTGVTANLILVRAIEASQAPAALAPAATPQSGSRKRSGTSPEEIVEAIRYLCSDGAAAVSGARLPLFGG